ncbi:Lrp/AsnC family transcriptional regulator [Orrella sp. JC864]|uniref:Lrp/AsnC family transcriptional regulator n=1 Tax=Orrella sp. JC864 TaxID=3120298 RepID=UPI0012BC2159
MDKIDVSILQCLQQDGRASAQQLSDQVGLSAAPVWRRVRALEAAGVITGYGARLDREKIGLSSCMFVQIGLERHSADVVEHFERSVRDAPEILECHAVTGDADFLLKILVESPQAYDRFLHRFLFNLPGIRQTRTIVSLRELKHDSKLPLRHAAG